MRKNRLYRRWQIECAKQRYTRAREKHVRACIRAYKTKINNDNAYCRYINTVYPSGDPSPYRRKQYERLINEEELRK